MALSQRPEPARHFRHHTRESRLDQRGRTPVFQFFPLPEFWKTLFTSLVGVLTLVGIMTRPFRWNEALIAMAGAGVLLILGLIGPADAFFTLVRDWNTFLFFL
jgi:arsenical pump membrane protein